MPTTYTKIAAASVGAGGASSIVFSAIPGTYTDLVIKLSGRTTSTNQTVLVRFNSDTTTTNYRRFVLGGVGSGSGFSQNINDNGIGYVPISTYTASTFGVAEIYIPNYAGSGYKAYQTDSTTENNAVESYMALAGTYWNSTAAITSITLTTAGNWAEYSTATLYGVLKYTETGTGSKAVGGTVTTSGGYTYHTFYSSGMFTPTTNISGAEVLVIAGGGAGGSSAQDARSGGGGAGGLVYASSQSFTSGTGYPAIVGAGGAKQTGNVDGNIGSNSAFGSLTVAVGGGGGGRNGSSINGSSGGSGGGGGSSSGTGGAGTAGQGNAGGAGGASSFGWGGGGGGGGAGGAGQAGNTYATSGDNGFGGDGGVGSSTYSAWGSATSTGQLVAGTYYYAGGGGGGSVNGAAQGTGGYGGGGDAVYGNGNGGLINTGSGGGAGGASGNAAYGSGSGGSGIIIVRYTT